MNLASEPGIDEVNRLRTTYKSKGSVIEFTTVRRNGESTPDFLDRVHGDIAHAFTLNSPD